MCNTVNFNHKPNFVKYRELCSIYIFEIINVWLVLLIGFFLLQFMIYALVTISAENFSYFIKIHLVLKHYFCHLLLNFDVVDSEENEDNVTTILNRSSLFIGHYRIIWIQNIFKLDTYSLLYTLYTNKTMSGGVHVKE